MFYRSSVPSFSHARVGLGFQDNPPFLRAINYETLAPFNEFLMPYF